MEPTSENDGIETAIELPSPPERRRPRNFLEKWILEVMDWFLLFTSENALAFYILIHWLLACASHIAFAGPKDDDNASFLSFIYFMSTLVAFLSFMSHVTGLLIPLFAFCSSSALFLFFLVNLSVLEAPDSQDVFRSICLKNNVTSVYYEEMIAYPAKTIIKTYVLIVFYVLTCATIMFQVTRNEEYLRRPQPPMYPGFYPHMIVREVPVGASNLDEPPRYSTLEPNSPPKPSTTSSTVTSPPRYSYWERTFGIGRNRDRTTSQCSEQSNRDHMMTAKSH